MCFLVDNLSGGEEKKKRTITIGRADARTPKKQNKTKRTKTIHVGVRTVARTPKNRTIIIGFRASTRTPNYDKTTDRLTCQNKTEGGLYNERKCPNTLTFNSNSTDPNSAGEQCAQ